MTAGPPAGLRCALADPKESTEPLLLFWLSGPATQPAGLDNNSGGVKDAFEKNLLFSKEVAGWLGDIRCEQRTTLARRRGWRRGEERRAP
ncbi:hypothetical protein EYF80_022815 [Liparis tanakae]|uniref:Uncharacterized protein n=1 Tax=Liparis tanakae TaxID=230148 RepID=A0A4Z2HQI5_9TELE|nr:hypothetical protein EYF80_022815 [Liparis tanakae]